MSVWRKDYFRDDLSRRNLIVTSLFVCMSPSNLLTIAGWTQNCGVNVDTVAKCGRFDSYYSPLFIRAHFTDALFTDRPLSFELHHELALEITQTQTIMFPNSFHLWAPSEFITQSRDKLVRLLLIGYGVECLVPVFIQLNCPSRKYVYVCLTAQKCVQSRASKAGSAFPVKSKNRHHLKQSKVISLLSSQ